MNLDTKNITEEIIDDFEKIFSKRDRLTTHIQALKVRKSEIETDLSRAEHTLARLDEATPKKEPT